MSAKPEPRAAKGHIACPQCGQPLPLDARICPHCGVDLALVALLAERAYLEGLPGTAPLDATPEALVPRIGEYLMEQGLLTSDQLDRALHRQKQLADQGEHRLLGQTLVELEMVDRETLDRAITRQIIELHAALQEANRTLERRVAERTAELRRALERLTELNQLKANLISNVSHELRTPLAHIKGYTELLIEDQLGDMPEEQRKALMVVQRATERLERLIEDLIDYSTASREGLTLTVEPLSLAPLSAEAIEKSKVKAAKAGVEIQLDIDPDLPPLMADESRIRWVLFQLIDNAVKFTAPGGKVRLQANRSDGNVLVRVIDSGIGIPADRVDEIFEPFHQLDGSPTRRFGGTGLGLSLVKLILNAHGAELHVQSQEGKGSAFSFELPLAETAA